MEGTRLAEYLLIEPGFDSSGAKSQGIFRLCQLLAELEIAVLR
jgi:hypothetical protein